MCTGTHARPRKTRKRLRMRALEGGRDDLHWVCVRGIRSHVCCVLAGTISVARRLREGRAEGRCLAAMRKRAGFFVEKPGTGVSFARPDCREIGASFVWAKPDFDRTESQPFEGVHQVAVHTPAGAQCHLFVFHFPTTLLHQATNFSYTFSFSAIFSSQFQSLQYPTSSIWIFIPPGGGVCLSSSRNPAAVAASSPR